MPTDNTQEENTTPEPYRQTLRFNVEVNLKDNVEVEITTKKEIEIKF